MTEAFSDYVTPFDEIEPIPIAARTSAILSNREALITIRCTRCGVRHRPVIRIEGGRTEKTETSSRFEGLAEPRGREAVVSEARDLQIP